MVWLTSAGVSMTGGLGATVRHALATAAPLVLGADSVVVRRVRAEHAASHELRVTRCAAAVRPTAMVFGFGALKEWSLTMVVQADGRVLPKLGYFFLRRTGRRSAGRHRPENRTAALFFFKQKTAYEI